MQTSGLAKVQPDDGRDSSRIQTRLSRASLTLFGAAKGRHALAAYRARYLDLALAAPAVEAADRQPHISRGWPPFNSGRHDRQLLGLAAAQAW